MRWNTYIARKLLSGGYGMLYNWFCTQQQPAVEYGYLYNFYAATDSRNICSVGWHLPTLTEKETLRTYIDPSGTSTLNVAGKELKESGTTHWSGGNTGTNSLGFNGRGSGQRVSDGSFALILDQGMSWTSTIVESSARVMGFTVSNDAFTSGLSPFKYGWSVRPIKDSTTLTNGQTGTYVDPSGIIYPTICIGTQEWVACNIMTKHYRNGDAIPEVTDNTAWAALTTGARCSYNNTESNAGTTKKLSSSDNFIVPTRTIWESLLNSIDTYDTETYSWPLAGGKLKEIGFTHWNTPNTGATNEVGFMAVGSGGRGSDFVGLNTFSSFFTTDAYNENSSYELEMYYDSSTIDAFGILDNFNGSSIRLCNPTTTNANGYVGSYTQNDGTVIPTIVINGVEWTMNLKETKWSDGTDIQNITDNTAWSLLQSAACCDINNDPTKR